MIRDRNLIHSKSKVVKKWSASRPGVVAEDFPGYLQLPPDHELAQVVLSFGVVDGAEVDPRPERAIV